MFEPNIYSGGIYDFVETHLHQFDLVLTFDRHLLSKYPDKCKFVHAVAPHFIEDQKIHEKTKLCSIIFGAANVTDGHRLRKQVYLKYNSYFDVYKTDETPRTLWKDEFMNACCFSVVIENSRGDYYFSEKILDCFRSGTIPIYWGTRAIGEFFDLEGMITFDSLEDLEPILKSLSFEEYKKRFSAVEHNFHLAEKYPPITSRECSDRPCTIDAIWPYIKTYFSDRAALD
jgi:hypothetical protein